MPDVPVLDARTLKEIAGLYLPSRWHYHYAHSKLKTDPLYAAVVGALDGTQAPLLDLGCGMGLLPHYCKASGLRLPYFGVDNDAAKIRLARAAAARAGLERTRFGTVDLAHQFPEHAGSVAILDMLQFLPPERMQTLVTQAARCIAASGRLVIRTGLQDASWRTRVTRAADVLARASRWMNAAPRAYPAAEELRVVLAAEGLNARFTPLWGNTPFNNWLIVAHRH